MDFIHLHVHSHYSLLDGLMKPKAISKYAKERGMSAIALTDYGSMYGAIEFYQACLAQNVKPIVGFEAYVAPRRMADKDPTRDAALYHLVLLAENYEGYVNLMALSSLGHIDGFFNGKPRIDKEALKKYRSGIIALSGCIRGEIPQLLKEGRGREAGIAAAEYREIFGADNFFLEVQDHPAVEGQMPVNTALAELGRELGISLVATRDVHYARPEDAEAQDILCCIREGWQANNPSREDFRQVDRSLSDGEEIASRFRHEPEAIENTAKIAARVSLEIPMNQWHFAPIELPPGATADGELRRQALENVSRRYGSISKTVRERMELELGIIQKKGYSPYFLCVADYVHYAKSRGIVETTRGSAAGSIVSYIIGITTVDPLRFNLPFERFLNPFRPSPPDVDTDFADDRRDEMIQYVTDKYGADRVAQIITFGTMAARASVRDVGRALGFSYSFCDQVAKLIPLGAQGFPMTIARALAEEPDLKKLYDGNADVRRLLNLAKKVEGCARHTSIHAAGVVIAPSPLTDFTPIQREVEGERIITQYEMKSVEAAGLLKMDFLGIRNLSILGKAVEIVEKTTGARVDIYSIPLDDKDTFEMLSRGETMGTFQLGGSGMTRWLKELKPTTIDDIMAMVALYRPGPMESIPEYISRKNNPELVRYLDPRMEKFLDKSYGIIVYQDDLLFCALELAGYNWEEVDKFRKAVGKKIPEEMAAQKEKLTKGIIAHGQTKEFAEELWKLFEPFQAYGFNKAHAASYGIFAYQTAYMKAHYPVQYMTSALQAEAGDADKVAEIVHECRRMGIEVLPPDINESFRNFAMVSRPGEKGRIRFGLSAVKNVGEHICKIIYEERKRNGAYAGLEDFLVRVKDKDLNKKSLESLVQAGALDSFGVDRGVLLANVETMLAFARQAREDTEGGQHSLFSGTGIAIVEKLSFAVAPGASMEDKLRWEKILLGLYISSHPFAWYAQAFESVLTPLSEVEGALRDSWITVGGVVDALKKKITKKGSVMMFATIQDQSGSMDILVFPKTYEETQALWREGAIVCVVGKTPKEAGDNKVFAERVYELTRENAGALVRQLSVGKGNNWMTGAQFPLLGKEGVGVVDLAGVAITIRISKEKLMANKELLKKIFADNPGGYQISLRVGEHIIRTQTRIDATADAIAAVEAVAGPGSVSIL